MSPITITPMIIARQYMGSHVRIVYSDFIIHNLHYAPTISVQHVLSLSSGLSSRVNTISASMIEFLMKARYNFDTTCTSARVMLDSDRIKILAYQCFIRCKDVGHDWTIIREIDSMLYKLCEFINDELFF